MSGIELDGYSIQQLAAKAGVSIRTIRFYIDEGLLSAPPIKGRYSVYTDEYLDRLKLITRLKESFLPLKAIRERVSALSWDEVKQALTRSENRLPLRQVNEPGENALSYINNLLSSPSAAVRPNEQRLALHQPETWVRFSLSPGIELHIRADASPAGRRLANQVIDYARKVFNLSNQGGQ